jgi:hypothetical protein
MRCSQLVKCKCSTNPLCWFWSFFFPIYQVEYAYFINYQQGVSLSNRRSVFILNWCQSNDNVSKLLRCVFTEMLLAHGDRSSVWYWMLLDACFFVIVCVINTDIFAFKYQILTHLFCPLFGGRCCTKWERVCVYIYIWMSVREQCFTQKDSLTLFFKHLV